MQSLQATAGYIVPVKEFTKPVGSIGQGRLVTRLICTMGHLFQFIKPAGFRVRLPDPCTAMAPSQFTAEISIGLYTFLQTL